MRRRTLLFFTVLVFIAAIMLATLIHPQPRTYERPYYGVVNDTSSTVNSADGQVEFTISVLGPDIVPMNERQLWCVAVDVSNVEHPLPFPSQVVKFKYLNELHTAIEVTEFLK